MYNYDYSYVDVDAASNVLGGFMAMLGGIMMISSIVSIIMIVSQWIIFKKAGKNGWEAIIPIYNFIVLLEIAGLPLWYIALFFVPFANIYAIFKIYIELAHKFNKSTGFGILTVFFSFICLPILAFGKSNVYNGGNTQNIQNNNMNVNQNNDMVNNQNTNNLNNPQPFVFDQNVNTEINNIQTQSMNTNINPQINTVQEPVVNQAPMFNPTTPIVDQEQTLNVIPNVETVIPQPIGVETMNNMNNQTNQTFSNVSQPINTLMPEQQQQVFNPQPTLNVIPNIEPAIPQQIKPEILNNVNNLANPTIQNVSEPVNIFTNEQQPQAFNQQPTLNVLPSVEQTPIVNQPITEPQLNVIPGMGQVQNNTMPGQNNNIQNN